MLFISMGIVYSTGADYETYVKADSKSYFKLVFTPDGKRLIGALFFGNISHAGVYRYVRREGTAMKDIKSYIIINQLHYGHFLRK